MPVQGSGATTHAKASLERVEHARFRQVFCILVVLNRSLNLTPRTIENVLLGAGCLIWLEGLSQPFVLFTLNQPLNSL